MKEIKNLRNLPFSIIVESVISKYKISEAVSRWERWGRHNFFIPEGGGHSRYEFLFGAVFASSLDALADGVFAPWPASATPDSGDFYFKQCNRVLSLVNDLIWHYFICFNTHRYKHYHIFTYFYTSIQSFHIKFILPFLTLTFKHVIIESQ